MRIRAWDATSACTLRFQEEKRPRAALEGTRESETNFLFHFLEAAMASGGPLQELCEEATCSICLDYFSDPVMIAECGHNFCGSCLRRSWGKAAAEASCPQCRGRAEPSSLRPNLQLANFVEIAKKFTLQERKAVKRGLCQEHGEPLELFCQEDEALLCLVCGLSKGHRDHQVVSLEEAAREKKAARKGRVCQKHQEPLKLFCKDDEALICVVCDRSKEHRDHETLPLEEASQEYKDQFCNCLETLKKERERIEACKRVLEKESQDLLKQTKEEKQETVAKFRKLHKFLEEQEELLLAQMEEVEKEVARKRDRHLFSFSVELSSLESLIQEIEEKCQQPAIDVLQDARSTLQRYKEKESFENPVVFPLALKWHIWEFLDLNLLLEGIKKEFQVNVTLDPDTAHPQLILSEDQKSLRLGKKAQKLPKNPERFDQMHVVLGREGFTGGCHFWEVLVGSEEEWAVGVARKSVRRKGVFTITPEVGIWEAGKWGDRYSASTNICCPPLAVSGELKKIRVCLNYAEGQVAFFDADRGTLLYEYTGASFNGETLLPFFWVFQKGYLRISS